MRDFFLETKLKEEAPELHTLVTDGVVVLQEMLHGFRKWFPDFTDHSILHSLDVLEFCNALMGEDAVRTLSPEACFVLIMACYLHDAGMGVTEKDYRAFSEREPLKSFLAAHPEAGEAETIRRFHHELSGFFIEKYSGLFEIPSKELEFAIIQVSRGHRKTDLYDETEYPVLRVGDRIVDTACLAAVIRLADEIDVGAGRNSELLCDSSSVTRQVDIDAFGTHESIRDVVVEPDRIILQVRYKEPRFEALVKDLRGKVQETLDYCREVTGKRGCGNTITQKTVEIIPFEK